MAMFKSYVAHYQRVKLNFPGFSYGFPMFPWFSYGFSMVLSGLIARKIIASQRQESTGGFQQIKRQRPEVLPPDQAAAIHWEYHG